MEFHRRNLLYCVLRESGDERLDKRNNNSAVGGQRHVIITFVKATGKKDIVKRIWKMDNMKEEETRL